MKPLALDLCCGKGGWTIGLQKAGWDVIGVDIEKWEGYPGMFVRADVRRLGTEGLGGGRKIELVVASPPCQEFSYRSFPFKRCRLLAETVPPDKSIWESCVRIAREVEAPLVIENVRGAQKYMGKASAHYGSFYLWGDVPAMLPIGKAQKTFTREKNGSGEFVGSFQRGFSQFTSSKSKARKEWSAKIAMIPVELAEWIGKCFYPVIQTP